MQIVDKTNETIQMSDMVRAQVKGDGASLTIDSLYLSPKGNLHLECLDKGGNLFKIELETAQYPTITPKTRLKTKYANDE